MKREELLQIGLEVMKEVGISALSMEEVARRAGISRTTLYRYFPGGREEYLGQVVAFEALRWLESIGAEIDRIDDLVEAATRAIIRAHETLSKHEVLQKVMREEPHVVMPLLVTEAARVLGFIHIYVLTRLLGDRVRPGLDLEKAADYVARMVLSVMVAPTRWDLRDEEEVRRLVRAELFAGILEGA